MSSEKRESRVVLTQDQHRVLVAAAENAGMALSTYLRWSALEAAAQAEIRTIKPREY